MTAPRTIQIPELCLVVLIGPSGSGKSTFARRHFLPTEIVSSDFCRGLIADDENDQRATKAAFEVLHTIATKRLEAGRLTVVDATNVQPEARKPLVRLARETDCLPAAIVLNVPPRVCTERNRARSDREFGAHVVRQQASQLRRSLRGLKREGFRHVHVLDGPEAIDAVLIERVKLWNDERDEHGPFDIVGDVHGCFSELVRLLERLGWEVESDPAAPSARHPGGRKVVFLGDLVDRGPASPAVLRLAMRMVADGTALCVPGNHDAKLARKLKGRDVRLTHGLAETMAQLAGEPDAFRAEALAFLEGLVGHYVLDGGRLVVAHAGMKEPYQGRASRRVREFALYGETTGETDEYGLPVRYDWASAYRGAATVVYGHTPVPEAQWVNRTICIDTGCVFGGKLTALRWPERELVDVPAEQVWYEPVKPLAAGAKPQAERAYADLLDVGDVLGKQIVTTRILSSVTIREEHAIAALEVMSRFAADPHWLIYLPPTMSPPATAATGRDLERPEDAFAYYRREGVAEVVCEAKHMGSRAVIVCCRSPDVAARRFGARDGRFGLVHTRTGRPFFADLGLETRLLRRVRDAVGAAGLWDELGTDWLCLDAELMPWSAKAKALLREQYAAVGSSGRAALDAAVHLLENAVAAGRDAGDLLARFVARREDVMRFAEAYRRYCWEVEDLDDLKLAPFHLLASEGRVHTDRDHVWHMETCARLATADPKLVLATAHLVVHVTDPVSVQAGVRWWEALTADGGEGMVVKPRAWNAKGRRGHVQPAVKCRGREYLRIIYGPEYTEPENLERLRSRALGRKRSLAMREYALGLEALHRFVEGEPLYRVHQCVFGVLALESEPVDPRL